MAKITNTYPDWVNAYRKKGQTIRKTTNGYGLYRCTSVYVPGGKPKSVQEYLGMIYKDRGFVPNAKDNKEDKSKPHYLEYGLSTFIMNNFKREIRRAAYNGNDNLLKLSVIKYIYGSIDERILRSSYLTCSDEETIAYSHKVNIRRLDAPVKKIEALFKDIEDAEVLKAKLSLILIDINNDNKVMDIDDTLKDIVKDKYKLW